LKSTPNRWARLAVFAVVALAIAVAAFSASSQSKAAVGHVMTPATMQSPTHIMPATPLANPTGLVRFTCQQGNGVPLGGGLFERCYGPDQIRAAYGVTPLITAGADGTGKTIVIIDAYGSPTLVSDLNRFNALWLLPAANVNIDHPFGIDPTSPGNAAGWAEESSLDVQWAHAIAPGAKIEFVEAKSNNDADILAATKWAVDNNVGDVISQSFGEAEACFDPTLLAEQHQVFEDASAKGMTVFASSGDQGSGLPSCTGTPTYIQAASTPASDPDVTAVGGTNLRADLTSGAYQSESTWNESLIEGDAVAGGGGISTLYKRPDYQAPFVKDSHAREVPDVSYNAAIFDGVIVAFTLNGRASFFLFGGTSCGSPQWAALAAITDQLAGGRVGNINKTLYKLAKTGSASSYFHDIADGSTNAVPDLTGDTLSDGTPITGTPIAGFTAVPGYDMATGLGSPIASALLPAIAKPGQG
jgi:subtilase family serine protease